MAKYLEIGDVVKRKHVTAPAVFYAIKTGRLRAKTVTIDNRDRVLVLESDVERWQPRMRPGTRDARRTT